MAKNIRTQLIQLFGYETDGGRSSILWSNPIYFSQATGQGGKELDDEFSAWLKTKRAFTKKEIVSGTWQKIGDHGWSFLVVFHPDGTFTEKDLNNQTDPGWNGRWELLADGILETTVDRYGHYVLYVIANKDGTTHSGIENGATYFKLIHS